MEFVDVEWAGVFFDLDGVLILSESIHAEAYRRLFASCGVDFTTTDFRRIGRGVARSEVVRRVLGEGLTRSELQELMDRKEHFVTEILSAREVPLVPGSREIVAALRDAGVKCAVASVSRMANEFLNAVGLRDEFDLVLDGKTPGDPKPAPDVYLTCAKYFDLKAEHCLVVEDSAVGIAAARSAGMMVLGLSTTAPPEQLMGAHRIVSDMDEVADFLRSDSSNRTGGAAFG